VSGNVGEQVYSQTIMVSKGAVKANAKARLPAAERRKKILAAARAVFLEQGFSGARTKDIADRSGVTEAFLYRHFESKEQMYDEAILHPLIDGLEGLASDIKEIHRTHRDPIEFVRELNYVCLAFYMEYAPLQAVALYSELGNGRDFYNANLRPLVVHIGDLIADRVGWKKAGLDPLLVGRVVLGAEWAVGLDYMMRHKKPDMDSAALRMTQMFTGGIKEKSRASA
jgi:AcrR family transcriptional regulator